MAKSSTPARRASATRKRKNILIDQRKLDAAKAALGVLTETEAVDAALDLVVFRTEVFAALDHVAAAGGIAAPARNRRAG
jgi:Arc/MetJ family transcription regulator